MDSKFKEMREKLNKIGNTNQLQELMDAILSKHESELQDLRAKLELLENKMNNSTLNEKIDLYNQQLQISNERVNVCNNNVTSIQEMMEQMITKIDQIQSEALGNSVRLSMIEKEKEEKTKSLKPAPKTAQSTDLKSRSLSLSKIRPLKS